jgi:hypothetical protein
MIFWGLSNGKNQSSEGKYFMIWSGWPLPSKIQIHEWTLASNECTHIGSMNACSPNVRLINFFSHYILPTILHMHIISYAYIIAYDVNEQESVWNCKGEVQVAPC